MQVKLALPKGRLLRPTGTILQKSGLELSGYDEQSRSYRPQCPNFPDLFLKIFNERDIPIQVAVGNYDLGICGQDWVEELLSKYSSSAVVKVKDLGYGKRDLCVAAGRSARLTSIDDLKTRTETIRIATEYPNIAELFALNLRLRRFSIFPLWGGAEIYPPESADLALISLTPDTLLNYGLLPLTSILCSSTFLIAHRRSWESKDMGFLLDRLCTAAKMEEPGSEGSKRVVDSTKKPSSLPTQQDSALWLALPDGHQQEPTLEFLEKAGIKVSYCAQEPRRPSINLEGVRIKVIRPQDMPLQVANGNFDLAITGEDWLYDHLYRFPSSPAKKILSLGYGKVRIVSVVSKKLPFNSPEDFRVPLRKQSLSTLRIASEYINIADRYARDNHLSPYRLLPTWGASEAFLPEDADMLIENTQTGRTIAQHNLKIIDTLFESSACLIGSARAASNESKQKRIDNFIEILRQTVEKN